MGARALPATGLRGALWGREAAASVPFLESQHVPPSP